MHVCKARRLVLSVPASRSAPIGLMPGSIAVGCFTPQIECARDECRKQQWQQDVSGLGTAEPYLCLAPPRTSSPSLCLKTTELRWLIVRWTQCCKSKSGLQGRRTCMTCDPDAERHGAPHAGPMEACCWICMSKCSAMPIGTASVWLLSRQPQQL